MQLSPGWSLAAFFLVPLFIWLLAALTVWRKARGQRPTKQLAMTATAFIAGADGRLSLSRLQAFAWTLVIFGAYAAAFIVHVPYTVGTAADAAAADSTLRVSKGAIDRIDSSRRELATKADIDAATLKAQEIALDDSTRYLNSLASQPSSDPATEAGRVARIAALQTTLLEQTAKVRASRQSVQENSVRIAATDGQRSGAASSLRTNATHAAGLRWVTIPAALLALAGLSIGTGIFSSLISNVSGQNKNPCVTAIDTKKYEEIPTKDYPELGVARSPDWPCAIIRGRDLGTSGYARFGSTYADVLYWASNERTIVVQVPSEYVKQQPSGPVIDDAKVTQLVVDTPNGKRVYALMSSNGRLHLGESQTSYDWLDLFRDDSNPAALALTKFQMFGWTVVALLMYGYTVTRVIRGTEAAYLSSLPDVDASLVILMGLSQAAYLVGKAVSGVAPAPTPRPAGTAAPTTIPSTEPSSSEATNPQAARSAPPGPLPED